MFAASKIMLSEKHTVTEICVQCTAGDPLTHALQRLIISTSLTYGIANRLTFRIVYDVQKVRKQRENASARRQPRPAGKIERQEKRHTPRGDHRVDVHETDGRKHGNNERHCDYHGVLVARHPRREARSWRFRGRGNPARFNVAARDPPIFFQVNGAFRSFVCSFVTRAPRHTPP